MGERDGGAMLDAVERRLLKAGALANAIGAFDLFLYAALLLPTARDPDTDGGVVLANVILFVPVLAVTMTLGHFLGRRESERLRPWLESDRAPTPAERAHALRLAFVHGRISAGMWVFATAAFTVLNAFVRPEIVGIVPVTMLLGGLTTATVSYLLAARIVRPVVASALAGGAPDGRVAAPGVRERVTVVWLCASGVPLLGVAAAALLGLTSSGVSRERVAVSVLVLALLAFGAGLIATLVAARSLSEPLTAVRRALERVERGDLDVSVPVDDASELGLVEATFNRMAGELRERERLSDVFGRHVGHDVARAAIDGELKLGGEVREVGVLFVDLIGSTALAGSLAPERVVALLNDFFAIVVAVTEAHGGLVNKFQGDGALCVFGAPIARDDPAGSALTAARELRGRLRDALPGADAAVGVSAGQAVAGNVGAEQRFEYTVIGDPVNEAARLCDLAKRHDERMVASHTAVERADPREAAHWALGEATTLRGREAPTRIATVS